MSEPVTTPCPHCGAPGDGNFCQACGHSRQPAECRICGAALNPDNRFCTQCGAARQASTDRPHAARGPWLVAGALSLLAVIGVLRMAGALGAPKQAAMPNVGNAGAGGTPTSAVPGTLGVPPDISNLTPLERFNRLSDRVLSAGEKGDTTTVIRFWPMASQAYSMLLPGDIDIDTRFHMAMLELMVGDFPATLALADSIFAESPTNLVGWYLRSMVAEYQQNGPARARADSAFAANFTTEMASGRPEYTEHDAQLRQFRREIP